MEVFLILWMNLLVMRNQTLAWLCRGLGECWGFSTESQFHPWAESLHSCMSPHLPAIELPVLKTSDHHSSLPSLQRTTVGAGHNSGSLKESLFARGLYSTCAFSSISYPVVCHLHLLAIHTFILKLVWQLFASQHLSDSLACLPSCHSTQSDHHLL